MRVCWLVLAHHSERCGDAQAVLTVLGVRRGVTDQLNSVCCAEASNCADGFPRACSAACAQVR
jgi:hypothetical protein